MPEVKDKDGKTIQRSRNLAGIRRFITRRIVKVIAVDRIGKGEGKLMILFDNGDNYETNFASFTVLCLFVRNWRNAHGSPLRINGKDAGVVSSNNPMDTSHEREG